MKKIRICSARLNARKSTKRKLKKSSIPPNEIRFRATYSIFLGQFIPCKKSCIFSKLPCILPKLHCIFRKRICSAQEPFYMTMHYNKISYVSHFQCCWHCSAVDRTLCHHMYKTPFYSQLYIYDMQCIYTFTFMCFELQTCQMAASATIAVNPLWHTYSERSHFDLATARREQRQTTANKCGIMNRHINLFGEWLRAVANSSTRTYTGQSNETMRRARTRISTHCADPCSHPALHKLLTLRSRLVIAGAQIRSPVSPRSMNRAQMAYRFAIRAILN